MSDRSAIEWTEATWNPVTGCDRVSAGCDHCYALTLAKRLKAMGNPRYQGPVMPTSSILANNNATSGPDCDGMVSSGGHNLLRMKADCNGFTGPGDLVGVDPLLG